MNLQNINDNAEKYYLIILIRCTIVAAGLRNAIQFAICHVYAHKYPELFSALEEYFQGVGSGVAETKFKVLHQQLVPIGRTLVFLIFLLASSYSFFCQFEVQYFYLRLPLPYNEKNASHCGQVCKQS